MKIIRDEEWLKTLEVNVIDHVETSYMLMNVVKVEKNFTTACVLENKQLKAWILYITSDPDYLDISQYISKSIYKLPKWREISYFNMILTTPLKSLERKGYPVDRVLQSKSQNNKKHGQKSSTRKPVNLTPQITQNLRNTLQDAIKACHSNFGSTINSQASTAIIDESQSSYCDVIPGHLLDYVETKLGIELYGSKGANKLEILSRSNEAPLYRFINMLKDIGSIFEIPSDAIHIFYDNYTSSVAFNRDRALFFNLNYYIGLHDRECRDKPSGDAMTYWYMTFCHELAHNLVQSHSSEHEVSIKSKYIFFFS
ncbi:hypothetical protein C1645_140589 [Glomus cerebriforme]|uniref:Uncharacterized protein n=1 Tax=Glomus cerebriforme TaxID=658196 RepID=A0A397TLS4_9GLOM|nr:hypothetical protein C1645_140589 [Glomus cerebriforme]